MEKLEKSGEILLEAVAYGDAAGLPVETRSAAYIAEQYGAIDRLLSPDDNPFFGKGQFEAGQWSDDTQLSLAVAEGLIAADGFDLLAQAETHIAEYDRTPMVEWKGELVSTGWGKATQRSVERLQAGIPPTESGEPGGAGNGVLMKMAPLVFWQATKEAEQEQRYAEYDALTRMTHDSDVAIATSRLHGDVLWWLIEERDFDHDVHRELADYMVERSEFHQKAMGIADEAWADMTFLSQAYFLDPEKILSATDGKGFYAPQTLAMVYGTFLYNFRVYEQSVYAAVNLGGDTDSTASIIGAMCALANGEINTPEDFGLIDQRTRLQQVSKTLTKLALKQGD